MTFCGTNVMFYVRQPRVIHVQDKPVRVKLHVSTGRIVDGTIGLESIDGAPAQLVVQAQG